MSAAQIPGRTAFLWIYREWIASKPRQGANVIEVGVALGRSIAALCEMLDEAGRDDVNVFAVDPWAGTAQNGEQQQLAAAAGGDFALYAKMMLEHAPCAFQRVRVLRVRGDEAAALFGERGKLGQADCVVLDGAHDYQSVVDEIRAWGWSQRPGGIIGGDDYHEQEYPGVVQAVGDVFEAKAVTVRRDNDWPTWRASW